MQLKQPLSVIGLLVCLVLATFVCRAILLDGKPVISLPPATQLGGIVAQSLSAAGTNKSSLVQGKDFNVADVRYFDNQGWIVASVNSINPANAATAVLHEYNGAYKIVLGPDTGFSVNDTRGLPPDVLQYLGTRVVILND